MSPIPPNSRSQITFAEEDLTAEEFEIVRDALVHLAILTGQEVVSLDRGNRFVVCMLVWYTYLTGQDLGIPSIEIRIRRAWQQPDEACEDAFWEYCITDGPDTRPVMGSSIHDR